MSAEEELPESIVCPITREIMTDPVTGLDGYTYEREAIQMWLARHGSSPMTRDPMTAANLVPNFAIRTAIDEYRARRAGGPAPTRAPAVNPGTTPTTTAVALVRAKDLPLELSLTTGEMLGQHVGLLSIGVALPGGTVPPRNALPRHVMCILDVSESMNEIAKMKGDASNKEKAAELTRLDLVAHSVRTLVHMLSDVDTLCIITFGDTASVVLARTAMTAAGKRLAEAAISSMRAAGGTNMWDGLRLALTRLEDYHEHVTMLLLSDGQPSINPPRGTLKTYQMLAKSKANNHTLHTFGYGYGLEYGLLDSLAVHGRGLYAYIPDASMVGTVFVNFFANLLSTAHYNITLGVKVSHGTLTVLDASQTHTLTAGGSCGPFALGPLQLVAPRTLCVLLSSDAAAELTVMSTDGSECVPQTIAIVPAPAVASASPALAFAYSRLLAVEVLKKAVTDIAARRVTLKDAPACLTPLVKKLTAIRAATASEQLDALIDDLTSDRPDGGQLGKSIARSDWWEQWGQHYLPAALRAHELEMCMNFKDASQQHYGGAGFATHQEQAEQIFVALPPPKALPRAVAAAAASAGGGAAHAPTYHAMNMYYDRHGGCFSGDSLVTLADGSRLPMHRLRRGDLVQTSTGVARVECLVVSLLAGPASMVALGKNLRITSWHPVLGRGGHAWHFPAMLGPAAASSDRVVFNVVLERGATNVLVGSRYCASLGHGISDSPVASHPFFATAVRSQLAAMRGWSAGLVVIDGSRVDRCPATNLITAWHEASPDASAAAIAGLDQFEIVGGADRDMEVDMGVMTQPILVA
eukprot:m.229676 g.229676  ORF g.229676 m.229676 type:complete len:809 (-) comp17801_c0_seq1:27-2453(-)